MNSLKAELSKRIPPIDPLSMPFKFAGFDITKAPEVPVYRLPDDLPLPPAFREEYNKKFLEMFGTKCLIPEGTVYMIGQTMAVMHPRDVVKMINIGI